MPTPSQVAPATARASSLRLTREGWYWLLGAIVLCLTGLVRGINLLTLLGCLMLVLWTLHIVSSRRRLHGLTGRRFVEEPIFAQAPFAVRLEISNPSSLTHLGLTVEDLGPTHRLAWRTPALAPGSTERLQDQLVCSQRGRSFLGPLVVSTRLPFGLMARRQVLVPREDLLVLPRLGSLHRGRLRRYLTRSAFFAGQTRHVLRRHPAAQADLHGLRSFRSGDSPRWIHWRTTARKGELMVREMEDMSTDNLILVFDPQLAGDDQFEGAVSLAATICWEWCRQTGDHMLLAVAGSPPAVVAGVTGRDLALRMLECLAVQRGLRTVDGQALLDALASQCLPRAPVLVVGAGPTAPGGQLGDLLGKGLRQPVACLSLDDAEADDVFAR
jgi:uncharacterized protein (DUF58 family)